MPSSGQQLIKNANQKNLYEQIRKNPGISRAQLSRLCHLSKPAVSDLTEQLIESGFLYDTGVSGTASVGRRPNGLELLAGRHFVLTVRFEEGFLNLQAVDICGNTAYRARRKREAGCSFARQARRMADELLSSLFSREQIIGICFIVPAMIEADTQEVYTTAIGLPAGEAQSMIPELKSLFSDFPAAILNDTACLAYAEKIYTPVEEEDFAFINFDRGIGAALFLKGSILGRASASYTQFGHCSVAEDGPDCSCGNRGCLERMIGEAGLPLSYAELGLRSAAMEPDACEQIKRMAGLFAAAVSSLVCLVRPRLIILGGNAASLGEAFLTETENRLEKRGFRRMVSGLKLRYSAQDADACFHGAMKYFFDTYYHFSQDLRGNFYIG